VSDEKLGGPVREVYAYERGIAHFRQAIMGDSPADLLLHDIMLSLCEDAPTGVDFSMPAIAHALFRATAAMYALDGVTVESVRASSAAFFVTKGLTRPEPTQPLMGPSDYPEQPYRFGTATGAEHQAFMRGQEHAALASDMPKFASACRLVAERLEPTTVYTPAEVSELADLVSQLVYG
jgi:hypothetical protein